MSEFLDLGIEDKMIDAQTSDDYYTFLRTVLAWVRVSEFTSDDIACLEQGDDPEGWKNRHCGWCEEIHEDCDCQ
jgi:hypothetical protein